MPPRSKWEENPSRGRILKLLGIGILEGIPDLDSIMHSIGYYNIGSFQIFFFQHIKIYCKGVYLETWSQQSKGIAYFLRIIRCKRQLYRGSLAWDKQTATGTYKYLIHVDHISH